MKLNYRVAHAQSVDVQKIVEHDGQPATLTISQVVVELVAEGHDGGTVKLVLPAGTEFFQDDQRIVATFTGAK